MVADVTLPTYRNLVHDWSAESLPSSFRGFVDETIRDGLQAPYLRHFTTAEKIGLLDRMERVGISDVIIGMAGRGSESLGELEHLATRCHENGYRIRPWVLARARREDLEELLRLHHRTGARVGMNIFIGLSDLRMYVEGWGLQALLDSMRDCLDFGRAHFPDVRVAIEDATRARPATLAAAAEVAATRGATRFTIADTAGVATPAGTTRIVEFVRQSCDIPLEWHGHNDRGLAVANTLESIRSGVAYVHGTMTGSGERNGNAALEIVMFNLADALETRIDWRELTAYYLRCRELFPASAAVDNHPYLGRNTFATGTGTHCAAIKKAFDRERGDLASVLFSPPSPVNVADSATYLISPMSGRRSVELALDHAGLPTDRPTIDRVIEVARKRATTMTIAEVVAELGMSAR